MDYLDERGTNPIQVWLADRQEVSGKAKAKIDSILRHLVGQSKWSRPITSNLDGFKGIVEIRIRYMNIQYRLLGCWGPENHQFSILYPAKEVGDEFYPPNAPSIAESRRDVILADHSRVVEHRYL